MKKSKDEVRASIAGLLLIALLILHFVMSLHGIVD